MKKHPKVQKNVIPARTNRQIADGPIVRDHLRSWQKPVPELSYRRPKMYLIRGPKH